MGAPTGHETYNEAHRAPRNMVEHQHRFWHTRTFWFPFANDTALENYANCAERQGRVRSPEKLRCQRACFRQHHPTLWAVRLRIRRREERWRHLHRDFNKPGMARREWGTGVVRCSLKSKGYDWRDYYSILNFVSDRFGLRDNPFFGCLELLLVCCFHLFIFFRWSQPWDRLWRCAETCFQIQFSWRHRGTCQSSPNPTVVETGVAFLPQNELAYSR